MHARTSLTEVEGVEMKRRRVSELALVRERSEEGKS